MTDHTARRITEARAKLDMYLTAAVDDPAWRREITAAYLDWLHAVGWRPPPPLPIPEAEGPPAPPSDEYRVARAALSSGEAKP